MKRLLYCGTIIFYIIIIASCGQKSGAKENTEYPFTHLEDSSINNSTNVKIDTSNLFIKAILNCSPKEVSKILGKPDKTIKQSRDCDYLPSCNEATYQNGKYEVLFYKDKLKWITINQKGLFNSDAIHSLGFESCEPTFSNPSFGIGWRNSETKGTATGPILPIKGLREVAAFPEYVLVTVETDCNYKF